MITTQYSDLFFRYLQGFFMIIWNLNLFFVIEKPSTTQNSPLVFESSKINFFLPLKDSSTFGTVETDAHISIKVDFCINHLFQSLTIQKLNTFHHICELRRTQMLTVLAMSVQNPQLARYILTGSRRKPYCLVIWLSIICSPLYEIDILCQYTIKTL